MDRRPVGAESLVFPATSGSRSGPTGPLAARYALPRVKVQEVETGCRVAFSGERPGQGDQDDLAGGQGLRFFQMTGPRPEPGVSQDDMGMDESPALDPANVSGQGRDLVVPGKRPKLVAPRVHPEESEGRLPTGPDTLKRGGQDLVFITEPGQRLNELFSLIQANDIGRTDFEVLHG